MSWELLGAVGRGFLFALAAILPIVNPAATAPVFLTLTEGASAETRALLARRIAGNMILLLAGSMLVGSYVLDFFGISLPIVRVGGGLVVAAAAWRLLSADPVHADDRAALADAFTPEQARRQAFYPLTFPISCGPGSIAAAITVGVSLIDARVTVTLAHIGGGLLALLACGVLLYFAFRYAQVLLRPLGEAGTVVFLRLAAFILLCLGVQIIWDGARELLSTVTQPVVTVSTEDRGGFSLTLT
ncbi:MarC family protein [Ramlibacter cellulosilyticus]|uniref:MarC family protein n=1 Tax=Ramlibacter cellulosilyticus TaxID=2764187 RepID=UPI003F4918A8